ncbi:class I SAM-dependent methyltransferase [Poriferisphaera sp. WC338]|uniref:class I SAM-dependent methyltransferase n=1 Tax=Poriferisphaera sp. WC338 TaxID=3425129 RepID=UPI003D8166F9
MLPATLTARQQREIDFYKDYAQRQRVSSIDFDPVLGHEQRPWNPYWYVYQLVKQRYVSRKQRLLDYGCGIGIASARFARLGYQVDGFDISEENLAVADDLAAKYQLASRCHFAPMTAENLNYEDNSFDMLVGIDILHHIDIQKSIEEAYRVLRPGGVAIFKEHIEAPIFEPIRQSSVGRWIAPNETSQDDHITDDERKLNNDDMTAINGIFDRVEEKRFTVVSRVDRMIPQCSVGMRARLQQLDHYLMKACPPIRNLGGTVVLTCHKSHL